MKADVFESSLLYDCYAPMLTEKQRTFFDLYYNQDLSLSEIALESGISRQSVYDTLSRTESALRTMEAQLGCVRRARMLRSVAADLTAIADELSASGNLSLASRVREAVQLMEKE